MNFGSFGQDFQGMLMSAESRGLLGRNIFVAKAASASEDYLYHDLRVKSSQIFPTVLKAYNEAVNRGPISINTKVWLSPDSHSLDAALVWAANMTHLVGMFPDGFMNMRSRMGQSTTFTPMMTVSGYGNLFERIYTMHGTAATDLIGWLISGERNVFRNCHFGGPMNAALGGHASYEGVAIDGSENYFESCVFGTDTIPRDEVSPNVTLGVGTLTKFKDCTFLCGLTDGDPVFFSVENTSSYTWAIFENCKFMAFNSNYATPMTAAFTFTGGASCAMILDAACCFQNVTALSDTAYDQYIWLPRAMSTTTDTEGLINVQLTI